MKFKDREIEEIELDSYIENIRYNPNTYGRHFQVLNGKYNEDKKYAGVMNILSLYLKQMNIENNNPNEILNLLFNNNEEGIGEQNEI